MSGLVGIGGGVILVPLLVLRLNMLQRKAQGTSLVIVLFSAITGSIIYSLNLSVDLIASLILALGAAISIPFGISSCHKLSDHNLKRYFGVLLIVVAIVLILKIYLSFNFIPPTMFVKISVLLAIGLVTGFISGLMGIGGGAITVSAMVIFAGMSQQVAQGSSLLAMLPTAAIGARQYWNLGSVETSFLPGIIVGMIMGTFLGGNLAFLLPSNFLTIVFALLLMLISVQYFRQKPTNTSGHLAVAKSR